ncbi:hypothetical protein OH781_39985 [Streptomyces sp. NBC_01550]|uniref:hypothetical protein n=1 Tax=Streptomyces sp. NBC_01550 TaxID=2975875 RepID=UPI0038645E04
MLALPIAREHLASAFTAAAHAEEHTWKLARLAESAGKSRIALHLAGTSMKEYRELTRRLSEEHTQYQAVEFDAKREARQARREAWDLVKQSRFAEPLGAANQPVSDHVEKVIERLVGMRLSAVRRDGQAGPRLRWPHHPEGRRAPGIRRRPPRPRRRRPRGKGLARHDRQAVLLSWVTKRMASAVTGKVRRDARGTRVPL